MNKLKKIYKFVLSFSAISFGFTVAILVVKIVCVYTQFIWNLF